MEIRMDFAASVFNAGVRPGVIVGCRPRKVAAGGPARVIGMAGELGYIHKGRGRGS